MGKKKTTSTEPVSRVAHILDIPAALEFLDSNGDVTSTEARLLLASCCGRNSAAAQEKARIDSEADVAEPRSARKTELRMQAAQVKASMDTLRMRLRTIIDTAALEYQNRAAVNAKMSVEEQRDAKRARFLKLRDWLRNNDGEWLDNA